MLSLLLRLVSLLVPFPVRDRWCEEWRAELRHGGWRMLPGALPDALTMRRIGREKRRQARGKRAGLLHALDQDVHYAIRSSVGAPGFTLAVVGSLAIGIGATTAAFTLVNSVLFRPFPKVHAQEELVTVQIAPRHAVWFTTSWNDYEVLRDGIPAFAGFSIAHATTFAVAPGGGEEPRQASGLVVSGNYFDVLGVRPALGRFFRLEEDGTPWQQPALVIGHRYWQRQMSGDSSVLQRTLNVNGTDLPIIGVAPEGFGGVFTSGEPQMWITFALSDLVFRDAGGRPVQARGAGVFFTTLVGRLRPGATIEQASAQGAALARALHEANDRGEKQLFVRVEPLRIADPARYWPFAVALMSVPLIVLAIACVNAANLLLARATRRSQDWLVRLSLGATRWRLVRQMLVESLLLAFAGGAMGLTLAFWGARFIQQFAPTRDVVIDANVAFFAVAAAAGTALVFGLGPALSVSRAAISRAPARGRFLRGPFGSRTRAALVVLQAALCLGLLATGGQFTNTLRASWDEGLPDAGHFLVVPLDVDKLRYDRARAQGFYGDLLGQVQQLPMVRAAALTGRSASSMLSGLVLNWGVRVSVDGQPEDPRDRSLVTYATAGFFETMGTHIVQGRTFTTAEQRPPVRAVIVNEAFTKKLGGEALGRVVQLSADGPDGHKTITDAMIVGVVAASPGRPLFSRLPNVFYPAPVIHEPALDLLVRFDGDADGITTAVRTIVSGMDGRLPLGQIATGEDLRRRRHASDYAIAQTVSAFGGLALFLAAAGLYGVVSYMVMLRQREIGIRMALGAARATVLYLVLRQALVPVALGCVLGAAGAVATGSLVRSRLYGVSAMDPVAFGGAALLLVVTMVVASLAPARRAARVDPIEVLRTE
jgi:putative ABC transport system permease protein